MITKIGGILILIMVVIGALPFIGPEIKIEWTTYLGIPLIILMGSTGIAVVTKRFEAIIGGVIISALLPALLEAIQSI